MTALSRFGVSTGQLCFVWSTLLYFSIHSYRWHGCTRGAGLSEWSMTRRAGLSDLGHGSASGS